MNSIYNEYGYCRICSGIATGGIHAEDCPHSPGYVSPEEQLEQLEREAEAEIGRLREQVRALSRIVRRTLACGQLEKLEDARPYLDEAKQ